MRIQEVVDLAGLMGREIVRNHMDFFAARLVDDTVRQKGDELRGRVSRGRLAEYLAGLGVKRRVQRRPVCGLHRQVVRGPTPHNVFSDSE
jgi:hypothetical protein